MSEGIGFQVRWPAVRTDVRLLSGHGLPDLSEGSTGRPFGLAPYPGPGRSRWGGSRNFVRTGQSPPLRRFRAEGPTGPCHQGRGPPPVLRSPDPNRGGGSSWMHRSLVLSSFLTRDRAGVSRRHPGVPGHYGRPRTCILGGPHTAAPCRWKRPTGDGFLGKTRVTKDKSRIDPTKERRAEKRK